VGDHQCGARGSNDPSVVLVDRFGCRSRQAARGPLRPRAKSLRITSMGLATRCESIRVAKKRRKLGPGGKARRPVAGSQPNEHAAKAGSQGSTLSTEGALGQGSRSSLTGWRWKRFWFLARGSGFTRVLAGRDRERQRCSLPTLLTVENTVAMGAPPGATLGSAQKWVRTVSSEAEARRAPSCARQPGAALPQGSTAPMLREH
jgi:hypothetical protein